MVETKREIIQKDDEKDPITIIQDLRKQKEEEYKIPCPCRICEAYITFKKIEEDAMEKAQISGKKYTTEFKDLWNEYRRRHWFCYKDLEMEELQRDDPRLIKEEIARSKRQDLHSFFE